MTALSMVINNSQVSFTAGQAILEAARANQIRIPTLCHLKSATPTGACRICVVEDQGARTLLTSCSAPAAAGMIVRTDSPRVIKARKTMLELMLSSGHHNCASANAAEKDDWTGFQMNVQEADASTDL